ncbi:MAG: hypothetical protein ABIH26_03670 [Candidatus Eisenbacteria bacterium]
MRVWIRALGIALFLPWLLGCDSGATGPEPPDLTGLDLGVEDYRVYGAALDSLFGKHRLVWVIADSTTSLFWPGLPDPLGDIQEAMPGLEDETLEDFRAKNVPDQRRALEQRFELDSAVVLVSSIDSLDTCILLSRVGFDVVSGQALVYVEYYCGALCGWGDLAFLEYVKPAWRVRAIVGLMMS